MLTSAQRRHLRSLAHHLDPVVFVGSNGLSDGVVRETEDALTAHELIKVRLDGDRDERKEMATSLAAQTRAELAQLIGRVALLYRPAPKATDRRIVIPPAS